MLFKNAILLASTVFLVVLSSCEKFQGYNKEAQLAIDIDSISKFVSKNNIPAIKDASGLYYQIIRPGNGMVVLEDTDTIYVNFTGRLLNDSIVERVDSAKLVVSGLIEGWQKGLKIIPSNTPYNLQRGGQMRLIVPSSMAYINRPVYTTINPALGIYLGIIPPNSNLNYSIELLNIYKKVIVN